MVKTVSRVNRLMCKFWLNVCIYACGLTAHLTIFHSYDEGSARECRYIVYTWLGESVPPKCCSWNIFRNTPDMAFQQGTLYRYPSKLYFSQAFYMLNAKRGRSKYHFKKLFHNSTQIRSRANRAFHESLERTEFTAPLHARTEQQNHYKPFLMSCAIIATKIWTRVS